MKNPTITLMKGICILLVVAGHAGCPLTKFIYLFHMPVFFMISGYLFKREYFKNKQSLVLLFHKRILRLWVPYVITNMFFLLLSGFTLSKDFFYKALKILFFCCEPPLGDASWFLGTLFSVTILFACISYILSSLNNKRVFVVQTILAISLLYFSYFCQTQSIDVKLVFLRVFSVYIIFYLGYLYQYKNMCANWPFTLFSGIAGGIILLFFRNIDINLGSNIYTNPPSLIIVSIAGWHFIYLLADIGKKSPVFFSVISYIGNHTMPILLFHWLCFSLIGMVLPHCVWWLKTLLAVIISLGCYALWNKLKHLLYATETSK